LNKDNVTRKPRVLPPTVVLTKEGTLRFTAYTCELLAIQEQDYTAIVLYLNRQALSVAIEFTTDKKAEGAVHLYKKVGEVYASASTLLYEGGFSVERDQRFNLHKNECGLYEFDLQSGKHIKNKDDNER
jgi:hypothetical protein